MTQIRVKTRTYQKCPICDVYYDFVTNVHCLKEHGKTKKEIEAEHGEINFVKRKVKVEINGY